MLKMRGARPAAYIQIPLHLREVEMIPVFLRVGGHTHQLHRPALPSHRRIQRRGECRQQHHVHSVLHGFADIVLQNGVEPVAEQLDPGDIAQAVAVQPIGIQQRLGRQAGGQHRQLHRHLRQRLTGRLGAEAHRDRMLTRRQLCLSALIDREPQTLPAIGSGIQQIALVLFIIQGLPAEALLHHRRIGLPGLEHIRIQARLPALLASVAARIPTVEQRHIIHPVLPQRQPVGVGLDIKTERIAVGPISDLERIRLVLQQRAAAERRLGYMLRVYLMQRTEQTHIQ